MSEHGLTGYPEPLLDHFENPRNVGEISEPDAEGIAGNPACGDRLQLTLRIRSGRIEKARFRASGCSAAIASASMTTVLLEGRTLREATELTDAVVAESLGGLPPTKIHCSVLAEEAIRAALDDYARKEPTGGRTPGTA
jgi:nitrogen fixation NifU-like protein